MDVLEIGKGGTVIGRLTELSGRNVLATSSKVGFIRLQCPHQGAVNATIASFSGCCVERQTDEHAPTNKKYPTEWMEDTYKSDLVKRMNIKNLICRRGRGLDVRLHAGF